MDAVVILGIAALLVSIAALLVSATLAARQIRLLRNGNHLPAIVGLLSDFRKVSLHNDYYYLTEKLGTEHDPQLGLSSLPEPARTSAYNVAYYFNTLAFMVGFGIFDDQRLFVTAIRQRVVLVWHALKPYVYTERSVHGFEALVMLEALSRLAEDSKLSRASIKREHKLLQAVLEVSRRDKDEPHMT